MPLTHLVHGVSGGTKVYSGKLIKHQAAVVMVMNDWTSAMKKAEMR